MTGYDELLEEIKAKSREIFNDDLTGIYLHGSSVMGCFNPGKSDIDLIYVVEKTVSDEEKRAFMDMIVSLNGKAPEKGIELSIVRRSVCDPFIYPTPFELHFSAGTLDWYERDPEEYIRKMNGTDKDLAAHFTVIKSRGKALYGLPIDEVFGDVSREAYFDSIWHDIENAAEDITEDPMYMILNLTRVLAFCKEGRVLSKKEGGEWGLSVLPGRFGGLIRTALGEYVSGTAPEYDKKAASEYAEHMLTEIKRFASEQKLIN